MTIERLNFKVIIKLLLMFLAVFEVGSQVHKEQYWNLIPSPTVFDVRVMAVDSNDNLYAAVWGDGIYRSANKGSNWIKVGTGLANKYINCMEIDKNGKIYAGTYSGGLFVSTDGGNNWTSKNNGIQNLNIKAIGIANNNTVYLGTYGGGIYKTIDGCSTWVNMSDGIFNLDVNCIVVTKDSFVVAGTNGDGIYKSTNGGISWYSVGKNIKSKVITDFALTWNNNIYTTTYGGGIYVSYTGGSDWQPFYHEYANMPLYGKCIAILDDQNFMVGMYKKGAVRFDILMLGMPGETPWRLTSEKTSGLNDVAVTSDLKVFSAGPLKGIFRSNDKGLKFTDSLGFYTMLYDTATMKPIHSAPGGILLSSSPIGGIFISKDRGNTWSDCALCNVKVNDYGHDAAGNLYAATMNGPYVSFNSGSTWTKLDFNDTVYAITADEFNIYIADTVVKRSTDGGNSWSMIGMMTGNNPIIRDIYRDNNGFLYAKMSTSEGIRLFISKNYGETWINIQKDMIFDLGPVYERNGKIYTTYGDYYYESDNWGNSWIQKDMGLPHSAFKEIVVNSNNDAIVWENMSNSVLISVDSGQTCDTVIDGMTQSYIKDITISDEGDIYVLAPCLYRGIQGTDLEAPALIVPDDNKGGVELHPLLSWSSVANCDMYEVQVALDAEFSEMAESAVTGDSKWRIYKGLENGLHYFWRARSKRNKSVSAWSETRSFFTVIAAPELKFPEDSSYSIDTNITFLWNKVDEAGTYQIQVSKDEGFKDIYLDKDKLTLPSCLSGKMATGTQYWWRVKSKSFMSNSDWSEAWVFTTKFAAPLLKKPTDKAITQNADVVLSWSAVAGATEYNVVIASDAGLKNVLFDGKSSGDSSHAYGMYEVGKTYYWKVRARDAKNEGYWSEVRSFTISQSELALRYPENNARYVPNDVNFEWIGPAAVDGYHIQISKEEDFKNILLEDASVTGFTKLVENLDYGYYYWRVRYKLGSNYSEWTDVWVFMTDPGRPVLLSPSDKSPSEANPVKLQWDGPKHAEEFMLEVARDTEFKDIVHKKDKLTEKSYTLPTLKNFEKLYWRVRFLVNKDTSMWSDTWAFTTELQRTYLKGPGDNLENSELTLQFFWNKVPNAEFYELQLAYDTEFGNIYNTFDEIADTFKVVADLDTSRTYFWRVRAKYSAGAGPWSVVWKFRTKATRIGVDEEFIARVVKPLSYPNPLFGSAILEWGAEAPEHTRIDIIDVTGAKVMDLFEGISAPGRNYLRWDASAMPAGTYFYRIVLGGWEACFKFVKK